MRTTWKIHLENVYRIDREERLRHAYEIVVPENVIPVRVKQEGEAIYEEEKHRPVCKSLQQSANA